MKVNRPSVLCHFFFFFRRNRDLQGGQLSFKVVPGSLSADQSVVRFDLINAKEISFTAELHSLSDNTARLLVNEKAPLYPRYQVKDSLVGEPSKEE